jgi:hypothetical protein
VTILMVDTYVVKPDKLGEYTAFLKKVKKWMKKRKDLFKEVKSHRFFSHLLGGKWGGYVEMYEFENLADFEKFFSRAMRDKEFMTKIYPEAASFTVPGSESVDIWNSVM